MGLIVRVGGTGMVAAGADLRATATDLRPSVGRALGLASLAIIIGIDGALGVALIVDEALPGLNAPGGGQVAFRQQSAGRDVGVGVHARFRGGATGGAAIASAIAAADLGDVVGAIGGDRFA